MIGQTISHYKILEKLGEGGMGVVYKAQDTKLDRIVALKFLPHHLIAEETEKARFLQEAKAASALSHPNVCVIHDIAEHDVPAFAGAPAGRQQFIVMEYVDGMTLREKVQQVSLKTNDAISYAIQIGEALQEAHSKGIVHRDIKADNIMVNTKNQVKVMDFGLAKLKGSLKLTRSSSTVGTLAYMAPEQIQGGEVDARSDIFSFGVVLYEMLSGRTPFRGEHDAAMMYSILNEEPEPIQKIVPNIPSQVQHILDRALEKDPADRYQTVSDMIIELRRARKETTKVYRRPLQETTGTTPTTLPGAEGYVPAETPRVARPLIPTRKTLWIAIGGALVVVLGVIVLLLLPKGAPELNPNMTFRVLQIPFTQIFYPGLSPDGNWVAFPAADANGRWDVYFMNTSGGEPRRITSDSSLFTQTADISPDGSQIAYDRFNQRAGKLEVCVVSSLGGLSKRIAEAGVAPRWRPDGQRIGYIVGANWSKSKKLEFWSVKPDGNDNRLEFVDTVSARGGRISFSWSSDGQSVAWLRTFPGEYQEVIVHDLETGKERQLTSDKKNVDEVCWTRQDEIIFSSNKSGNTNLWMVPAPGGHAVQLTKGSGPDLGIKISADGKKLLYLQQQQIGHIWIASSDGSSARQITFDDRRISAPSLSPNGKQIAFEMYDPDPLKSTRSIYLMDRDGANRRELTSGDGIAEAPEWSPDGKWISYHSHTSPEPHDSARIYLIDPSNPGSPRLIGKGFAARWVSPNSLIVFAQAKSWLTFLDGTGPKQFYQDSTFAFPVLGEKYILYYDLHKGREGGWIVPHDGSKGAAISKPKKILSVGDAFAFVGTDGRFVIRVKDVGEVWKVSLPDGKQERIRGTFPGLSLQSGVSASHDGKELIYVDSRLSAKLVLIENLHK